MFRRKKKKKCMDLGRLIIDVATVALPIILTKKPFKFPKR